VTASDLLIVGAGPTGLTMACELARRGVGFRIVDRDPVHHGESRATDIHPRTLELFHDIGVLEPILERAARRTAISMYADGERFLHVQLDGADTPYCFMCGLPQNEIEHILETRLGELGGKVERNVRLAGICDRGDDGVDATLLHPDHTWTEPRFRYLIGCDGAHSAVRAGLEMALEGSTFEERFLVADVKVDWDLAPEEVHLFSSEHGVLLVLGLPGGWVRLFGDLDEGELPALDRATCEAMIRDRVGTSSTVREHGWIQIFKVHTRMAREFQRGRVFLAGDAAHIHSPVGGHGMNTGIQDAYNLAWKLALVCSGGAGPTLLDSYSVERMPIARGVLDETDLETRISLWRNPLARGALNTFFGLAAKLGPVRRKMIAGALETTVAYRKSPIVGEHRSSVFAAPVVHSDRAEAASLGDRAAFSDGPLPGDHLRDVALDGGSSMIDLVRGDRHTLLLFDGHAPTEDGYRRISDVAAHVAQRYGDRVRVHVVVPHADKPAALTWNGSLVLGANVALHARYGAHAECAYLVRPDRYIGFRSQPIDRDALDAHFTRVFGAT